MKSFKRYREERRERQEYVAAEQKEVLDRIAETAAGFPLPRRRRVREMFHVYVVGCFLGGSLLGMIVALYVDEFSALISGRQVTYVDGPVMEQLLSSDGAVVGITGVVILLLVVWVLDKGQAATRRLGLADAETDGLELQPEETSPQEPI